MPVQNAIEGPLFVYFTKTFYLVGIGILRRIGRTKSGTHKKTS